MDFPVKSADPAGLRTECAIVPVFKSGRLPAATEIFDKKSGGLIRKLLRSREIGSNLGDARLFHHIGGSAAKRILTVGCGERDDFNRKAFGKSLAAAATLLKKSSIREAISYLSYELPAATDAYYAARLSVETFEKTLYTFNELKSETAAASTSELKRLGIAVADRDAAHEARRGANDGIHIAHGTRIACDLGNRPPNVCTPTHLAEVARGLAEKSSVLSVKVLPEASMRRLGMGALLSVTQGASEPAQLIVMEYRGAPKNQAPIALCGKGITFDTGGISLKPPPKMDEMKYDMCGAASVIGTMAALLELRPNINVIGIVPACENMPGGSATRPGDIVTSLSGKTVEVLNTDAEGRLILCDAITYAQTFKPRCIIDIATLTGACVIALGNVYAGVFSNDLGLTADLIRAGERTLDLAWHMPADAEYGESLRSNFADFANVGSRDGGASVAAAFLSRFVEKGLPWAHLDIAGVAWRANSNKGATGRPVSLLVDFLLNNG